LADSAGGGGGPPPLPAPATAPPPPPLLPPTSGAAPPPLNRARRNTDTLDAVTLALTGLSIPLDARGGFLASAAAAPRYTPAEAIAARAALQTKAAAQEALPAGALGGAVGSRWGHDGFVLSGYVWKRSAGGGSGGGGGGGGGKLSFSSWTWRYAQLGRGAFSYFASEFDAAREAGAGAKGAFALHAVAAVAPAASGEAAGKAHALRVCLANGKVFVLAFQTSAELAAWGGTLAAVEAWGAAAAAAGESLAPGADDAPPSAPAASARGKGGLFSRISRRLTGGKK
jgi:hypothetical protein